MRDERSRGIRALTRPLSVSEEPERLFVDVVCTTPAGLDVFNVVAGSIIELVHAGTDPPDAVRTTLGRWRRFWGVVPESGLTDEEVRGLFGELWFLDVWLLPRGHEQLRHWVGPWGARHDFQWAHLAIEVKATVSVRGHVHRINGIDQLEPPNGGDLQVFSLRIREEATASNSITTLIDRISSDLADESELMDLFETRLAQAGYSPLHADRYRELRFRIVNERLYRVAAGFPRLSLSSFVGGLPTGIEEIQYDVDLDVCPQLLVASSPADLVLPPGEGRAES